MSVEGTVEASARAVAVPPPGRGAGQPRPWPWVPPTAAEADPGAPDYWLRTRTVPGEAGASPAVSAWYLEALPVVAYLFQQCGAGPDGAGASVLDVAAGSAVMGRLLRTAFPGAVYHFTEQSPALVAKARELTAEQAPDLALGAAAVWRCDAQEDARQLRRALERAPDGFLPRYSVVLLNHVVECLPYPLTYAMLDACWELVQPHEPETGRSGFLLVNANRFFHHRSHPVPWDWSAVVEHLAQYARPVLAFDNAMGGGLLGAVWRPPLGTPTYPGPGELRP